MRERPAPEFRAFARRVLDAGADVLRGHSARIPQGIEVVHERPSLYDTGDFVDDYAVDPVLRNDLSALFLHRLEDAPVTSVDLLPVRISYCRVSRATGADHALVREALAARCGEQGTTLLVRDGAGLLGVPVAREGAGAALRGGRP
jgi:poly-gamma-glutamate synthesis protein (capsule biosynthesis protein)